jgi:hypothetical protein
MRMTFIPSSWRTPEPLPRQESREARRCGNTANRNGASNDPKADAAVRFAAQLLRERGHVSEADVKAVKAAGYDDAQLIEIVQHVALNTWTNYVNEASRRKWTSRSSHRARPLKSRHRPSASRANGWRGFGLFIAADAVTQEPQEP